MRNLPPTPSPNPTAFSFNKSPAPLFLLRSANRTMESSSGATDYNWSETVEDLVHGGEIDKAISFLESKVSSLEKEKLNNEDTNLSSLKDDQLSTVFLELSKLYSTKGLSLKADQALSRALQIKHKTGDLHTVKESTHQRYSEAHSLQNEVSIPDGIAEGRCADSLDLKNDGLPQESSGDDELLFVGFSSKVIVIADWEAIADRAPDELLSPKCLPEISNLSLDTVHSTKQRGRGSFSYKKHGLYSDYESDLPVIDDSEDNSQGMEDSAQGTADNLGIRNLEYGTRHVIVLADFPPSTRTTDLENVLEKFKDRVVIRWVNDAVALAVFKTPSVALEASTSICFPYTVRVLAEDDELLSLIPPKDLEPPRQRPRTSARTAQRMIAQGMGIKLPSTVGSAEYRKQEDARKNRIVSRQNMRDDAWGDDGN
ncbi:coiled-coil domain-containing protein R3HCC1L isoform X2 [Olea europaea var. sylvestris]|uniref:coiled-coil domain-containing protein R3HCC1L isoform X2 n=1 Tax=Olea europaea var. sylvestris TaxID=158386 RepID=UPI000C1D1B34|nr:coiled-coil domain-containing protein R3HCC1L isoform X2 [Olea europaea var. sylvestris]